MNLTERIDSGGKVVVRLFESAGLRDSRSMLEIYPFFKGPDKTFLGSLKSLHPMALELVSGSNLEPVWGYLVKQYP